MDILTSGSLVALVKSATALGAAAVLLLGILLRRRGRPHTYSAQRDAALAVLGAIALAGWWNFGLFNSPWYIHRSAFYHYYLGAKYFSELGYTNLYECTVAADIEDGLAARLAARWIRDLNTNVLRPGASYAARAGGCRQRFTLERWLAFKRDLTWFRSQMTARGWANAQADHGYNAPPAWGAMGGLLANTGPASDSRILLLALLDPLLLLAMWATVWWAFGWRIMCVALIWWGCNYPARFSWTGGAFLRADWLVLSTIGICLARRGAMSGSGFAVTYASLIRIFPAFLAFGLAIKAAITVFRWRSTEVLGAYWRFALGSLAAAAIIIPLSGFMVGGSLARPLEPWTRFVENSRRHFNSPSLNRMGLKPLLSFELSNRSKEVHAYSLDAPWDVWQQAQLRAFARRRPLYYAVAMTFVALLILAVAKETEWVALVLGAGLIPVMGELACYYYAFLLVFAFLWPRYEWAGVGLCVLAALSWVPAALWSGVDEIYTAISAGVLLYVLATLAYVAVRSRREDQPALAPTVP